MKYSIVVQTASIHALSWSWILTWILAFHFYLLCLFLSWLCVIIFTLFTRSPLQMIYSMYIAFPCFQCNAEGLVMTPGNICAKWVQKHSFQKKCSFVVRSKFIWKLCLWWIRMAVFMFIETPIDGFAQFGDDVIKLKHFRVTGPLCGEVTGRRWIPLTKAGDAGLWCLLWSVPE